MIFFLLYHPICQLQLNHDLLSSWVGREVQWYHTAGAVMLKRHCLEVLIQLWSRAEAQSYQKAKGSRQPFLPCDLSQHTSLHV